MGVVITCRAARLANTKPGPIVMPEPVCTPPEVLRETVAAQNDTGVSLLDLELIRIHADFNPHTWDALHDAGAALKALAC